jgi:hypothetical protein
MVTMLRRMNAPAMASGKTIRRRHQPLWSVEVRQGRHWLPTHYGLPLTKRRANSTPAAMQEKATT